jgi:hypothetical protein
MLRAMFAKIAYVRQSSSGEIFLAPGVRELRSSAAPDMVLDRQDQEAVGSKFFYGANNARTGFPV